jgi:hypothetical protein
MSTIKLTWTARHSAELREVCRRTLLTTGLSPEAYSEHVFHHGCMFARAFADTYVGWPALADLLTIDPIYGFWAWWRMKWVMDDATILKAGHRGLKHYLRLKDEMLGNTVLEKELHQHILPLL